LCPNHHGLGSDNAVWTAGAWTTPLGSVSIEETVARELCAACSIVHDDTLAHAYEHAIEVQLPFLQMLYGTQCTIVPITMKRYILEDCLALGKALAQVLQGRNAVVIASSDFSHYEPAAQARRQDAFALEAITRLDPEALFARVEERHITTCGYGPVAVMLAVAQGLGANSAEELAYTNSGDINGDTRRVVGYAAVAVTR
ncbi:MAG TPA: AmmeMemoRadiSam system protein B, partial [Armatimonadota bacterium]|nr:AmmeMemoRadiSam system protein B [Armatimonadota bacterium]